LLAAAAAADDEPKVKESDPELAGGATGLAASGFEIEISPDGYTSARTCGRCHNDIYNSWKNSLHAFSLSDPIFDSAYMLALKEAGDEAKRLCLRCHAPMTLMNEDYDLSEGVTREGVSCDFCHTVTAVHMDRPEKPYSAELGLVKRSTLRKAGSPKHEVAYSELHGKAEFCGGCHNYVAPNGTPVMSTYEEWRRGPYAREGIQCQDCHMVLSAGKVVSEQVKETGPEIHLHNLIHDSDQVRSALSVQIAKAERSAEGIEVEVRVTNVRSGHKIPTGMPSRKLVLTVSVEARGRIMKKQRSYQRVLADKNGRTLTLDHETLLYAAKVVSDNRIGPREERIEHFSFIAPKSGKMKVGAEVSYVYTPLILDERRLDIKMAEAEQFVF
jgi:hypothetical protein